MEAKQRAKITCVLPGSRRLQVCNYYSLCAGVVLCPDADELVEVVRAEDGGVPGEVVEVVHDDGDEEVEHDEGAEEDEGDEVEVGEWGSAGLLWVEHLAGGGVVAVGARVALLPARARQHDVRPRFTRRAPESHTNKSKGPYMKKVHSRSHLWPEAEFCDGFRMLSL